MHSAPRPPQPQPWKKDETRTPTAYTRPLAGSELFADIFSLMNDGAGETCMGVEFYSSIDKYELKKRARHALDKLRFTCPIIAASVEGPADGRRWVYTPVQNEEDQQAWLDLAFAFEERGTCLNSQEFISAINAKRLPYRENGKTSLFRCYLLADDTGAYALYFHGPHSIMDGWPTFYALSLMFEWISQDLCETLDIQKLGTEWNDLPPDPITATGGPRGDLWETDDIKLLNEIATLKSRRVPCHTLCQAPRPFDKDTRSIRIENVFSASETKALVDAAKSQGFSVTHLLEAAHALALFKTNPLPQDSSPDREVDFSAETTLVSLERNFDKSIEKEKHFISSFSLMPIRISMSDCLKINDPCKQLLNTMEALRAQYTKYLTDPCLPHLLAAQVCALTQPRLEGNGQGSEHEDKGKIQVSTSLFTNLGVVEERLPTTWPKEGKTEIEIKTLGVGHRMVPNIAIHSWTLNSLMHLQVETCDVWDEGYLKTFLDNICEQARLILLNNHFERLG